MVGRTEEVLRPLLNDALVAGIRAENAQTEMRKTRIVFMHEARRRNWSWTQIGAALQMSEVAAKRYHDRNIFKVFS